MVQYHQQVRPVARTLDLNDDKRGASRPRRARGPRPAGVSLDRVRYSSYQPASQELLPAIYLVRRFQWPGRAWPACEATGRAGYCCTMSRTFGSLRVSLVFGPAGNPVDPDHATCLRYLAQHDVLDINMARAYGDGEELMGAGLAAVDPSVAGRFTVSTKVHPSTHASGTLSHESVLAQARESLSLLGVDSVDYFLIHQPDTGGVPLEETLRAADELYRAGVFRRFVRRPAATTARPTPDRSRPR